MGRGPAPLHRPSLIPGQHASRAPERGCQCGATGGPKSGAPGLSRGLSAPMASGAALAPWHRGGVIVYCAAGLAGRRVHVLPPEVLLVEIRRGGARPTLRRQ